jgi:signal transduction histidine kinase
VATAAGPGQAVLSVANTGPVIPAERVSELFQPFRRLAGDRPAAREGLGLGLPIVAAIAAAHGAALWAVPRPAGGLTVEIRFASPFDQGGGWLPAQRPGRPLAARSRQ